MNMRLRRGEQWGVNGALSLARRAPRRRVATNLLRITSPSTVDIPRRLLARFVIDLTRHNDLPHVVQSALVVETLERLRAYQRGRLYPWQIQSFRLDTVALVYKPAARWTPTRGHRFLDALTARLGAAHTGGNARIAWYLPKLVHAAFSLPTGCLPRAATLYRLKAAQTPRRYWFFMRPPWVRRRAWYRALQLFTTIVEWRARMHNLIPSP